MNQARPINAPRSTSTVLLPINPMGLCVRRATIVNAPAAGQGVEKFAREKRLAARIPHRAPAQLLLWPAGPRTAPIDVQVVDYSRTGVGIIHSEGLLVGQTFVVREPQVTKGSSRFLYKVVRCDRRPDSRFSIGLQVVENGDFIEPSEPPAPKISYWVQWAYFLYAAIGVAIVLILSMRWR